MQFKKSRAILAAVLAAATASTALMSVTASAKGPRTKAEKYEVKNSYKNRFLAMYDDVVTNGKENGYLSKDGVPYHSVEELICEAPDYGHETTSEAMSYIVWVAAMHDKLSGSGGELDKQWKVLEKMIPSSDQQNGFFAKTELSAQVAEEHPDSIKKYPSEGSESNTGKNPLHSKFVSAYKSEGREYLLHWLADVDDWYGFSGSARGEKGDFTFINTFQRGDQESCFETIPHPSIETLKYGNSNQGMKFAFQKSTAKSWSYTNAPDAEDRAIQAAYAANRWGISNSVSDKAGMMGDFCRNDMYDKYYKAIGCQSISADSSGGSGDKGKHYLMSWYTAWGGAADGTWAWQIGCSHAHQFYQNPLAAYGLLYGGLDMKAEGAEKDYETSLERQMEMYLWLSSIEGPFAGGCTNCWMGAYEKYPSGVPTFHDMAYIEQPVYADPGSNGWTGNQYWATQRLAELYYVIKTDGDKSKASPGGLTLEKALQTVLDKWVNFFVENSKLTDDGDYEVPSGLTWEGAPDDWSGSYKENSNLHAKLNGMQNTDLGCVCSLANTLIYYAAANGVKSSAASTQGTELPDKALYLANQLIDRVWQKGRDDIGCSRTEHNGSLARFWAQEVYAGGGSGEYPYGYTVKDGSTFVEIRPMYGDEGQAYSDLYAELKAAYDKDVANGAKIKEFSGTYSYGMDCRTGNDDFKNVEAVDLNYHRFWHAGDVMMANGAMALLYPDVTPPDPDPIPVTTPAPVTTTAAPATTPAPDTTPAPSTDLKPGVWGDTNCSGGVDVSDAVLLAKYLNADASGNVTEQGRVNANVIKGELDGEDLSAILMLIAKIITQTDCPLDKLPTVGA